MLSSIGQNPINALFFRMKLVIALLVGYDEHYQQANRHTDSQAKDIDKRKYLVFQDISKGGFKVVSEHRILWV
jgi:hypothetical protein